MDGRGEIRTGIDPRLVRAKGQAATRMGHFMVFTDTESEKLSVQKRRSFEPTATPILISIRNG